MADQLSERLALLRAQPAATLTTLLTTRRGIEKESLRITGDGQLAQTPHPQAFGSALTHAYITTDFSEALLELITPVYTSVADAEAFLDQIHRAVYAGLGSENLWVASMPCVLGTDSDIPLARYGRSNVATMKTVYRNGLGYRYGRVMQTIAGIHYNFSINDALWQQLQADDLDRRPAQAYITDAYFKLIRNFRRYCWLYVYLFGASPAVCKSFVQQRQHGLQTFDEGSLYLPYATSLRMGDLGYQSQAQEDLYICYNSLDNYIETLLHAITDAHPDYETIGLRQGAEYKQLSTSLLQIENEFYSTIRPKRVSGATEVPLAALRQRGVEYIEVRCIDVNPYLPLGISAEQMRFLDCFLLYCLFKRSPICDDDERLRIKYNLKTTVNEGRKPGLMLQTATGEQSLQDWGRELLADMLPIAELLDQAHHTTDYQSICQQQLEKLTHPELTPSAQLLADMQASGKSFFELTMNLSKQRGDDFRNRPLNTEQAALFQTEAARSIDQQLSIEASDTLVFDDYLQQYLQQDTELAREP